VKENVTREKQLEVSAVTAVPKIAKIVWKAPKVFAVRISDIRSCGLCAGVCVKYFD